MDKSFYENLMKESQENGINRYVVGAVVEKDFKILLLERPKEDFMGGIYELPSGEVEKGESLDVTLYREINEETGLKIKSINKYLGYFDYPSKGGKITRQFNFVVSVEKPLNIKLQEHVNFLWVNKDSLPQYPVTDSVKQILGMFWEK